MILRRLAVLLGAAAVAGGGCADVDEPPEANVLTGVERIGTVPGDPNEGESLFLRNCSSCHGDEGEGGFGPSLVESSLAERADAVHDQIVDGGDLMPAFGPLLTDQEVDDLTAYVVRVLADREKPPLQPGPAAGSAGRTGSQRVSEEDLAGPEGTSLVDGRDVYLANCASCHGPDGGGTQIAPSLVDERIPFSDVVSTVRGGPPGMPSFASLLGGPEITAVAAYVTEHLILGRPLEGGS